jgi:hypothetical protein
VEVWGELGASVGSPQFASGSPASSTATLSDASFSLLLLSSQGKSEAGAPSKVESEDRKWHRCVGLAVRKSKYGRH